jgi:3-dehydroquinate synthase class II
MVNLINDVLLTGNKFDTVKAIWLLPFRIPPPTVHYYIRIPKKRTRYCI